MNFIGTFDELNKLYENRTVASKKLTEGLALTDNVKNGVNELLGLYAEKLDFMPIDGDVFVYVQHTGSIPNHEKAHKEMLDSLNKNGYTVSEEKYSDAFGVAHFSHFLLSKGPVKESCVNETFEEAYDEEAPYGRNTPYGGYYAKKDPLSDNSAPQWWLRQGGTESSWKNHIAGADARAAEYRRNRAHELGEDYDDESQVEDDETEPKQVILECDKCGALVIKEETDIVADEETDLVNVEDKCQFCDEATGFKIIGVVAPYEATQQNDEDEDEEIEISDESEDTVKEALTENFLDRVRKALDLPAPTIVQQFWEALLNNEFGEISPELRKDLEKAFEQQRDWEARHPRKKK